MRGMVKLKFDRARRAHLFRACVLAGAMIASTSCDDGATGPAACPTTAPVSMGMADTVYVTLGAVVYPELSVADECRDEVIYHYDPALLSVEGDSIRTRGVGGARFSAQPAIPGEVQ